MTDVTASRPGQRPSDAPPYTSYALVRVAHLLEQRMDRLLSGLGVSATGFGVLLQLSNDPGVSSAELARRVIVTPQSIGPLLARLEREGLVDREPTGRPGTAIIRRITDTGRQRLAAATMLVQALDDDLVAGLEPAQRVELDDELWHMLGRLGRLPGSPDSPAGSASSQQPGSSR